MKQLAIISKILILISLLGMSVDSHAQVRIDEINPDPACWDDMVTISGDSLQYVDKVTFDGSEINFSLNQNNNTINFVVPRDVNKDVEIVIIDEDPNTDETDSQTIRVHNIPSISIDPGNFTSTACQGVPSPFNLIDISQQGDTYHWDFGDGTTHSQSNSSYNYTYSDVGSFLIRVQVLDDGCWSPVLIQPIEVSPNPIAEIINLPTDICANQSNTYTASATTGNPTYNWDFGDGSSIISVNQETLNYTYTSPGTRTISLTVVDTAACTDNTSAEVVISDGPPVSLVINGETIAANDLIQISSDVATTFEFLATGAEISWTASITSGEVSGFSSSGSESMFQEVFSLPEKIESAVVEYKVSVQAGECSSEIVFQLAVSRAIFIPNLFSPNDDGINDTWDIRINNNDLFLDGLYVQVFNRAGANVYDKRVDVSLGQLSETWEGSNCPDGAYWYILRNADNNASFEISGAVTLLRGGN